MSEELKNEEILEQDADIVVLEDEEGNELHFHYVTTLEHEGKTYACLQNADDDEAEGILEIFEIEEGASEDEFDKFLPIDDETYETLFNVLMEESECLCDCEGECDCDHEHDGECECDCGHHHHKE